MSEVPWYDIPSTGEQARIEILRARVVLARRQGEHERRMAALAETGITSFVDRADWIFDQKTPEEKRAWVRRWRALGLREIDPKPEGFERGSLATIRRPRRRRPAPVIAPSRQLEIAMAVLDRRDAAARQARDALGAAS